MTSKTKIVALLTVVLSVVGVSAWDYFTETRPPMSFIGDVASPSGTMLNGNSANVEAVLIAAEVGASIPSSSLSPHDANRSFKL